MDVVKSAEDNHESQEEEQLDPTSDDAKKQAWMEVLGVKLRGKFDKNDANRRPKEIEWLADLRQIHGIYDQDVIIEKNNSHAYPKITRAKVKSVLSRLNNMLFPSTDRNFTIEPSPEPEVAPEIAKQLGQMIIQQKNQEAMAQAQQTQTQPQPLDPQELQVLLAEAIKKYAEASSDKMQNEIDEQLLETRYVDEAKQVLSSAITFGTGIIRGPMVQTIKTKEWHFAEGKFVSKKVNKKYPIFKFTRIWDWYPDMGVTDADKTEGYFERHVMTKLEMQELAKRKDFYGKIIKEYLETKPKGDAQMKEFEQELQDIDAQNKRQTGSVRVIGNNYEVLEFWGMLDDPDGTAVEMEAWVLGNKVIKIKENEIADGKRPHRLFYYEKDETSIFGEGLPIIIRHSQMAVAAAARGVLDNAACVAGPQVEANISLLIDGQAIDSFYARKIWYREGYGNDAQYPALRAVEFNSHIPEILNIMNTFLEIGDLESCLPRWMISEPPKSGNEPVGSVSMRMSNITVSLEDIVKNFDAFTTEVIGAAYQWNMEFNPRNDIKGGFVVKAQGSSSLITKEVRMQALNLLSTTLTPEERCYVPARDFLVARWKSHDLPIEMLRTEDEAKPYVAALNDPEMKKLEMEVQKAEIDYKKAMTLKATAQAKDKNSDANLKKPTADSANDLTKAKTLKTHADVAGMIHDKVNAGGDDGKGQ
jgi:hypothetical protein